jgi:hypothetical protein
MEHARIILPVVFSLWTSVSPVVKVLLPPERQFMSTNRCLSFCLIFLSCLAPIATASSSTPPSLAPKPTAPHDGQHDFDFEIGTWKIHLKRLLHPLTGSTTWTEFDGTTYTQKVWNGKANIEQFETNGSAGQIEGMTLRLYNPESHQWSIYWATSKTGTLAIPTVGEFKDGVGEFYDHEPINGRMTLVRFIWSRITATSAHFEQSFSDDGGMTWEVNWITDQTRISEDEYKAQAATGMPKLELQSSSGSYHQHDFDFEYGAWKTHLKRLIHPLANSDNWVEYDGTSVVEKLWNGRANFGVLEVEGPAGHIEGLTLRLYNPESHQWRLYWANSKGGILEVPTIGQFSTAQGEFFDQEDFQNKSIFVRFIFSDVNANIFRTEQSFSPDWGKTWESNWVGTFTRTAP